VNTWPLPRTRNASSSNSFAFRESSTRPRWTRCWGESTLRSPAFKTASASSVRAAASSRSIWTRRSMAFTRAINSRIENGFVMYSSAPSSSPTTLSTSSSLAVSIRIGTVVSRRSARQTSNPSSFGSITSRMTRSGRSRRASSSASTPSRAATTSYPSLPQVVANRLNKRRLIVNYQDLRHGSSFQAQVWPSTGPAKCRSGWLDWLT